MIKLLVADDSALMRKLLEDIFLAEGDFEVRTARNGTHALEQMRAFAPDVVTLDIQMPGMDGLTCLGQIMIEKPTPVVMISSLTEAGAETTLTAIEFGAVDFVAKPSGTVSLEIDRLRPMLVEKVRAAAKVRIRSTLRLAERIRHQFRGVEVKPTSDARRTPIAKSRAGKSSRPSGLVLIGSSTGGPAALDIVLPQFPPSFPWSVLVAQHLPATFTGPFSRRLNRECNMQVIEVDRPIPLEAGTIYIGRGETDIVVAPRPSAMMAMPVPAQRDYPWHPSVERMVTSAMEHYEAVKLIGVLMTGMGDDGSHAMTRLRQQGGRTVAEAESTAVVWGMPGELVKKGGAESVQPVEDIAAMVIEWVMADALH